MDDSKRENLLKTIQTSGGTLQEIREVVEGVFGDVRGDGCMVMVYGNSVMGAMKEFRPEAATAAVAVLASCLERQTAFGARTKVAEAIDKMLKAGATGAEAALPHLRVLQEEMDFHASPEGQTRTIALAGATGISPGTGRMPDAQWRFLIESGGLGISKQALMELIATLERGPSAVEEPAAPPRESAAPSIRFPCEHCGKMVEAPHSAAGKRGKCPFCRESCDIPEAG